MDSNLLQFYTDGFWNQKSFFNNPFQYSEQDSKKSDKEYIY